MVRKVLAAGMLVVGFAVVIYGAVGEIVQSNAREPAFEPGAFIGIGVIIFGILVLGAYLLWPKSN